MACATPAVFAFLVSRVLSGLDVDALRPDAVEPAAFGSAIARLLDLVATDPLLAKLGDRPSVAGLCEVCVPRLLGRDGPIPLRETDDDAAFGTLRM